MNKETIGNILEETASLLELKNENFFKIRAYRAASSAILAYTGDIIELIETDKLSQIKGIGAGLADKIREIYITGKLSYLNELRKTVPEGLLEMLKIQGLGPKKVSALHQQLKIKSINELESACRNKTLLKLEGFGEKSIAKILSGIEHLKEYSRYYHLDFAKAKAEEMLNYLKKNKDFHNISIAGSLRRSKEIIKDIDIVSTGKSPLELMDYFTAFPNTDEIIVKGETKSSVRLKSGINVDLRIVEDKLFPYALHHFTGSKEHNTAMRSRAKSMDMKMNEYGLFKGTKLILCKTEEEIFSKLGLSFIPPELRENNGEIEAAEKNILPKLIEIKDIKGILHAHTNLSDAKSSLEEMLKKSEELGFEYIGITDHSISAYYAGGLTLDKINKQHSEIDKLNSKYPGILILKGIESDIRTDGSLDYPDKILDKFDFVIGSIHTGFNLPEEQQTSRIIKAIENPYFTMLGHPTGRMLLSREGYKLDIIKIIDAASKNNKIIELNSNPYRFDLDWRYLKYARDKGVLISINPDAHSAEKISDVFLGVGIARKGWLEKKDALNTMSTKEILDFLKARKP